MRRAIYVYCVVRSSRKPAAATVPPGLPGAERPAPVKLDDRLWIVTASVPLDRYATGQLEEGLRDLEWVTSIALAHQAVVEHFARLAGTTVIPMKLFTMFTTDARAAGEMHRRRAQLDRVFARIEGCEEWGVRVARDKSPATSAPMTTPASGAAFLAARKRAREALRDASLAAIEAADAAFDSLSEIAREARRQATDTPDGMSALLDAAFLVPARRRARFRAAARQLARDAARRGARMTLTGPWPAYNFVAAEERS